MMEPLPEPLVRRLSRGAQALVEAPPRSAAARAAWLELECAAICAEEWLPRGRVVAALVDAIATAKPNTIYIDPNTGRID